MIHEYFKQRDFAERMNSLSIALGHTQKFRSLKEIMINLSRTMRVIFSAENIFL